MTERFLTINQTAELLGVHHGTVRRMIAKGRLRAVRVGRLWRVPGSALLELEQAALAAAPLAAEKNNGARAAAR
jgi:excisionase family DNA binding protein